MHRSMNYCQLAGKIIVGKSVLLLDALREMLPPDSQSQTLALSPVVELKTDGTSAVQERQKAEQNNSSFFEYQD